ncbi:shikimate dehydrogenase [Armatimonas sp.]|uniref:shikimate dehydrogenase n=1 Tax=Armatimonas sp. TaxID=1872638 RepID=UPI0037528C18
MIRGTTKVCGVWGWPVTHSASPAMHNAAFEALGLDFVYVPFAVSPENLKQAVAGVRALGMVGVNVTVPLKERIIEFLDRLTERAERLGAVNTLFWEGDKLCGDSTDGPGFLAALPIALTPSMTAVVLGAGGSARAVVDALVQSGIRVLVANRTVERAEELVTRFGAAGALPLEEAPLREALRDASLLVNTTSIGMHPNHTEQPPVPEDALHPDLFVTDLIYNPAQTRLLARAQQHGCGTQNGIEMLVQQGAISFTRWTGQEAPLKIMRTGVKQFLGKTDTIIEAL